MKLTRIIVEQEMAAQYYDLGRDFSTFSRTMSASTEAVKNKFEQAIGSKLKNKKIRARASRGYKQFEKDYEIEVISVSIDDYYDNYVVVVRGKNNKDYFLKPGFKVQILGAIEPEPEPTQQQQPQPEPQQPPPSKAPQPQPEPEQPQPQQPEIKEMDGTSDTEMMKKYPKTEIYKDVMNWLPDLFGGRVGNINAYVTSDGVTRTKGNKTITSYGLAIPVDDLPGLESEQIKQSLSRASRMASDVSDIENFYTLEKFDVRNGKYILIIKKVSNF